MKMYTSDLFWGNSVEGLKNNSGFIENSGRIIEVGSRAELLKKHPSIEREHFKDGLICPSFVNAHDHGRGLGPLAHGIIDCILESWIHDPGIAPQLSCFDTARFQGLRLIASGVTTVVHCHNPRNSERLFEEAVETIDGYLSTGIRVCFNLPIADQNLVFYGDENRLLPLISDRLKSFYGNLKNQKTMSFSQYRNLVIKLKEHFNDVADSNLLIQLGPVGVQWCSESLLKSCLKMAWDLNAQIHMHLCETTHQSRFAQKSYG